MIQEHQIFFFFFLIKNTLYLSLSIRREGLLAILMSPSMKRGIHHCNSSGLLCISSLLPSLGRRIYCSYESIWERKRGVCSSCLSGVRLPPQHAFLLVTPCCNFYQDGLCPERCEGPAQTLTKRMSIIFEGVESKLYCQSLKP